MIRVSSFRAYQALAVMAAARDAGDAGVHAAAARVREGWLLGRPVSRGDIALVAAFAE